MTTKLVQVVDDKIVLPEELRGWVKSGEQLLAIWKGDTLILKRLMPTPLTEMAQRAADETAPSLEEIAAEVHRYREGKRTSGCP